MMLRTSLGVALLAGSLGAAAPDVTHWPQFRGPGGSGLGAADAVPPSEFGPQKALLWKTALPLGHGSPCVWGDRVFVTAFDKESGKLETLALDRSSGKIVWRQAVTPKELEKVHAVSSPATSTPVADGSHVYVYFGSYGLLAYEWSGKLAWEHPLSMAGIPFGSGNSPVLAGDLVLVSRDANPEPHLLAVSRADGKLIWKSSLPKSTAMGPQASHATPIIWKGQAVLHRPGELSGYALSDGSRQWWVRLNSQGTSTPVANQEAVFAAGFDLGDPAGIPEFRPWAAVATQFDRNQDGKLSPEEAPEQDLFILRRPGVPEDVPGAHITLKRIFGMVDADKDGAVDEQEWTKLVQMVKATVTGGPALVAIRPGGEGDLTLSAVLWKQQRNIPEVPSPLYYKDRIYLIANGGILSCLDAASGKVVYRGRVGAPGIYYSSPVAAAGKIFVASGDGVLSVLRAGDSLEVLSHNDLGDPVYGTPALVGPALYVRSARHLWAFGAR